jgi:hypothetical protein
MVPSPYIAGIEQRARDHAALAEEESADTRGLSEEDAETDRRLRGIHYYQFNNEPAAILTWDDIPYMINNLARSGLVREIALVKVEIDGFEVGLHVGDNGYGDPLVTLKRAPDAHGWFMSDPPPPLTEEWIRKFCGAVLTGPGGGSRPLALSDAFKIDVFVATLKPDGVTAFLECPMLRRLTLQRGMVDTGVFQPPETYTPAFHRLVQTHVSLRKLDRGWSRNWQAYHDACVELIKKLHTPEASALVALVSVKKIPRLGMRSAVREGFPIDLIRRLRCYL